MKLGCPICKSRFTISQAMHEEAMKEMVDLAARFGNNWGLVFDYTECFRTEQWGSVREQKRLRLLKEIWTLFDKCEFEIDGKRYRTTWAAIHGALRATVDADKFGFKNHNYLKRVLAGLPHEKLSAEGLTAREENNREADRASGRLRSAALEGEGKGITAGEYKSKKGIKSLVDQIGAKREIKGSQG